MLAKLHGSTAETHLVSRRRIALPDRRRLEAALDDVDRPWDGGPLSEAARRELGRHVDAVGRALRHLDELTSRLERRDTHLVVTHGEPHPGNLIETPDGQVMIDWDTVGLARPERDLWMIADSDVVAAYRDLTGIVLEREALIAYGLLWALTDVAAFTVQLRGEHELDADGEHALDGLRSILVGNEPAPYGSSIAASLPWAARVRPSTRLSRDHRRRLQRSLSLLLADRQSWLWRGHRRSATHVVGVGCAVRPDNHVHRRGARFGCRSSSVPG